MFGSEDFTCFIPCDGHSPRTGVLFATRTKWNIISVDPLINNKYIKNNIFNRLTVIKDRVENVSIKNDKKHLIIVSLHGHCDLNKCLSIVDKYEDVIIVDIPCCFQYEVFSKGLKMLPIEEYQDECMISKHNKIKIYYF